MRAVRSIVLLLFLLSGATSLVYEVVWLRRLILIFGSTQFATSTILSTFMGGLALGAYAGGRWLDRGRFRPLRFYGLLEIGIGCYALLVPALLASLSPVYQWLWDAGGEGSFVLFSLAKFAGIACVLLPPTALMGASLPALAREVADDPGRIGGKVGLLYAINTFGACIGTFVAGFVAIPAAGVRTTLWVTAMVNVAIGIAALTLSRPLPRPAMHAAAAPAPGAGRGKAIVLWIFAASGFCALSLEVAWTRILSLILGSSVYAFSLMLLAFLTGLASGGAAISAWLRRRPRTDAASLLALLLGSAGALAYATTFLFPRLPALVGFVFFHWHPSPGAWLAVQWVLALLVMLPATFALGGVFPAVLQLYARGLERLPGTVGAVYASNTVGTVFGAAVAGFLLIPALGLQTTVITVALGSGLLALAAALILVENTRARRLLVPLLVVFVGGAVLVQPRWDTMAMNAGVYLSLYEADPEQGWEGFISDLRENHEIVYAEEGLTATVFVADQPEYGNRYLSVNGKIDASTNADLETQLMLGHLPLLLHGGAREVMVIGLASGISAGAVAAHPVDRLRVVEVERAMLRAARFFDEANNGVLDDPRVEVSINDARNELEFNTATYDVIISEPSNPWMTVAANLFTEEFFGIARSRLRPGGIFCQWIHNYYLATEDLRSIVGAFKAHFPHVSVFETYEGVDLILLGSDASQRFDLASLERQFQELAVAMDLRRVQVRHPIDLLGLFRMGTPEVRRFVEGAGLNTDDNARVEFSSPLALGRETLADNTALIHDLAADPLSYVDPPIEDPRERALLTLRLAERWLQRGDEDLARAAARRVPPGPYGARAKEILDGGARESR